MVANENYMATCPKGLEHVLALELTELKAEGVQESVAGCYFSADLATAYRICLWSRLANRVLLLLARTRVDSDESLYQTAFGLPWGDYFSPDKTLLIDFNGTSSFIRDSRFGALRIKDAINDHFVNAGHTRLTIDDEKPDVLVYARLFNGRFSIGLDLVGESLHKRGYRSSGGAAPLKENLAAAILNQSDWPAIASEGGSFVDPMCGSGTLLIEAALMAANIPPTFLRTRGLVGNGLWTLTQLMTFNHDLWQAALAQQEQAVSDSLEKRQCKIQGYDINPRNLALAQDNVAIAGLDEWIELKQCDIANLVLDESLPKGLLVVNPPYGERLGEVKALMPVYRQLGDMLKRSCMDWQATVFTGNLDLGWQTGLRSWRQNRLYNGSIECQVQRYRVNAASIVEDQSGRGKKVLTFESLNENAQMLANRLRKNQKRLRKWLKANEGICYRLYDADLPEYAVAIDCYTAVERVAGEGEDVSSFENDAFDTSSYDSVANESVVNESAAQDDATEEPLDDNNPYASARRFQQKANKQNTVQNSRPAPKRAVKFVPPNRGFSPYKNVPMPLAPRIPIIENGLYIHVQEYAPPATIDPGMAHKRVKDAIAAVSCVFEIPLERIYVKRRERQRGAKQYQKQEGEAFDMVVKEQGHKFKVNLQRYLDTGIFLDHRDVRQRIASEVKAKRFLNLYSYTSSATVYAAKAGAASSVSVDMSNSYLNWSRHNFELNNIDLDSHQLVRADCTEWLRHSHDMFDCILLDPPSFSNSKKMDHTLDISRDHGELITLTMARLAEQGSLYFSTNKRGFSLDASIDDSYDAKEITRETLGPDFERGRPAHKCWIIRHR